MEMSDYRFVIWGCGTRGKRLLSFLGSKRVKAIVDSNVERQGLMIDEVEVISFKKYLDLYRDLPIIVAVKKFEGIVDSIKGCQIPLSYFVVEDAPIEFFMPNYHFPNVDAFFMRVERLLENDCRNNRVVLSKLTIFSLFFYNRLKLLGYTDVRILKDHSNNNVCVNGDCLPEAAFIDELAENDRIFLVADHWDEMRLRYNNWFIKDVFDFSWQFNEYENESLLRFKDCHKGARCFIVGNGPSLRLEDLEKLYTNNECCFGVNRIYKVFDKVNWRPNYFVSEDSRTMDLSLEIMKSLDLPVKLFRDDSRLKQTDLGENSVWAFHSVYGRFRDSFSSDISRSVCFKGTVLFSCLQIAVYMGFKEIYFIGADCTISGNGNNHFIKNYLSTSEKHAIGNWDLDEVFSAYQLARRYADRNDIKIYNATRGGSLEVFERVEFDSLFV